MTDKRQTPESVRAKEILDDIKTKTRPFNLSYDVTGYKVERVFDNVRRPLVKTGILVAKRGNTLFVSTKNERKDHFGYRNIIKKLMLAVDDEKLYEEARIFLEESYGF